MQNILYYIIMQCMNNTIIPKMFWTLFLFRICCINLPKADNRNTISWPKCLSKSFHPGFHFSPFLNHGRCERLEVMEFYFYSCLGRRLCWDPCWCGKENIGLWAERPRFKAVEDHSVTLAQGVWLWGKKPGHAVYVGSFEFPVIWDWEGKR